MSRAISGGGLRRLNVQMNGGGEQTSMVLPQALLRTAGGCFSHAALKGVSDPTTRFNTQLMFPGRIGLDPNGSGFAKARHRVAPSRSHSGVRAMLRIRRRPIVAGFEPGTPGLRFESSRAMGQNTRKALLRGACSVFGADPSERGSERTRLRRVPVSLRRAIKARLGRSHSEVRILSDHR